VLFLLPLGIALHPCYFLHVCVEVNVVLKCPIWFSIATHHGVTKNHGWEILGFGQDQAHGAKNCLSFCPFCHLQKAFLEEALKW
jgi:hypothetical protein